MPRIRKADIKRKEYQTWEEAMGDYLLCKKAQHLEDITIKGHRDVISLFYKRHPEAWRQKETLRSAIYAFFGENIKPATYNIRRNYLKQFFEWATKQGIYTENPLTELKKQKDSGRVVYLDKEILQQLLQLPDKKTYAGLRDYALITLTLDTGIRPKEAFSLLPQDVNLRAREIYIRSEVSKTDISRTLPISIVTTEAIQQLLASRHPAWGNSVPVFCTCDGTPLRNDTWGDRLEIYAQKLGVKIAPYDLRHAFAVEFLRNGGDVFSLQRIMGHADLSTTQRYVNLIYTDIKNSHQNASPVEHIFKTKYRVRKRRLLD